ncbi:hypothetical protein RJT34_20584 [Clitoria ternatea]|uniref:Uncharacterized protein n=1 Tax=Clitoria ternatea TaxID=43366 RepID=A0AAN9IT37_CLITE
MEIRGKRGKKKEGLIVMEKRRGLSTPPPTWRLEFPSQQNGNHKSSNVQEFLNFPTSLSVRNLCAKLWEIQPLHAKMNKPRIRLHQHRRDTVHSPSYKSASARSLQRHVQTSLAQHHTSVKRNSCTPQPISLASYGSSMQVALSNHVNHLSSPDFKGRNRESSGNSKTSTELLNVLNRIWCLEEQHASNVSAVKALNMELDLSRAQVKKLLQEKQLNKHKMENLMKQITEDKVVKNKGHDKMKAAVQSVKEEIEDERRLRKHSESLHRRLAKELSEVKSSFSASLRDLERERNARILLENLCDDFAKGIRDYEHEIRSLMRNNAEKSPVKGESIDRLILHLSEAWLDERKQMKLVQARSSSIVDNLGVDIETFLHAKRFVNYGNNTKEIKEIYPCLGLTDSFALDEAPHNMAEEDSINANTLEQKRTSEKLNSNNTAEVHIEKKRGLNSARKQVQSKEINEECKLQAKMGKNMSWDENESWFNERKSSENGGDSTALFNTPGASTVCDATQGPPESDGLWTKRMNSSHRLDNMVRNSSLSSEGDRVYPESIFREDSYVHSVVTGNSSDVKQRKSTLVVPDFDNSESCSRGAKDNSLMAKLLEARLDGQKSQSRVTKSSIRSIKRNF